MKRQQLYKLIRKGLEKGFEDITSQIDKVTALVRYGSIEAKFSAPFVTLLGKSAFTQRSVTSIGTQSYYPGRCPDRGKIDIALGKKKEGPFHTAFELKAVRMPRKKAGGPSGCLFDIGQLAADFQRLSTAQKCKTGWLVAYVYGPLVDDASGNGDLFRRFQNQMYVDFSLCSEQDRGNRLKCLEELGWNGPTATAQPTDAAFAVLYRPNGSNKALGAICYRALNKL